MMRQGCTGVGAESSCQPFSFIRSHLPAGPWAKGFGCYVTSFLTNRRKYYSSRFVGQGKVLSVKCLSLRPLSLQKGRLAHINELLKTH